MTTNQPALTGASPEPTSSRRASLITALDLAWPLRGQSNARDIGNPSPGQSNQEAFLVLSGECRLLVEGEERCLGPWDFFHSPPWTEHGFVGAGEGPCVILMAGTRSGTEGRYPVLELAARYGASVAKETDDWRQAYAEVERFRRERPPYLGSSALGVASLERIVGS